MITLTNFWDEAADFSLDNCKVMKINCEVGLYFVQSNSLPEFSALVDNIQLG
jgi:hypothetical protein